MSEASEKDDTRNPDDDGFRENVAWGRRGCTERPASLIKDNYVGCDYCVYGGVETGRGRESRLHSVGEASDTSARNESHELGGGWLVVSSMIVLRVTHCCRKE